MVVLCREPWTSELLLKELRWDTQGWAQLSGASVMQAEAPRVALGPCGVAPTPRCAAARESCWLMGGRFGAVSQTMSRSCEKCRAK